MPFHRTGGSRRKGSETTTEGETSEIKLARGPASSTIQSRRRRILTHVNPALKEAASFRARLSLAPGTFTRQSSESVKVVVPHPIMDDRFDGQAGWLSGERTDFWTGREYRDSASLLAMQKRQRKLNCVGDP